MGIVARVLWGFYRGFRGGFVRFFVREHQYVTGLMSTCSEQLMSMHKGLMLLNNKAAQSVLTE
jgi:uncharacterized membrane protein required for colicin V production